MVETYVDDGRTCLLQLPAFWAKVESKGVSDGMSTGTNGIVMSANVVYARRPAIKRLNDISGPKKRCQYPHASRLGQSHVSDPEGRLQQVRGPSDQN